MAYSPPKAWLYLKKRKQALRDPVPPPGYVFLIDPTDGSYLFDPTDGTYLIGPA
jgi:hypothetical protein